MPSLSTLLRRTAALVAVLALTAALASPAAALPAGSSLAPEHLAPGGFAHLAQHVAAWLPE